MKKHVTASENPICGSYFLSNSRQETIQNNLDPADTWFKNIGAISKKSTVIQMNCYQNLICLTFPSRKN